MGYKVYIHISNAFLNFRFKTKIPNILHEIYEGLGHQTPLEILTPSKQVADADDSFNIAEDDPASLSTTDYGSNQPSNQR